MPLSTVDGSSWLRTGDPASPPLAGARQTQCGRLHQRLWVESRAKGLRSPGPPYLLPFVILFLSLGNWALPGAARDFGSCGGEAIQLPVCTPGNLRSVTGSELTGSGPLAVSHAVSLGRSSGCFTFLFLGTDLRSCVVPEPGAFRGEKHTQDCLCFRLPPGHEPRMLSSDCFVSVSCVSCQVTESGRAMLPPRLGRCLMWFRVGLRAACLSCRCGLNRRVLCSHVGVGGR